MLKSTFAAVVLGVLVLAAPGAGATVDREFQESFDVAPGARLRLLHDDGDVDIQPWSEDRVDIHVRYHVVSRGVGGTTDFEVDFTRSGDTIEVEGREIGKPRIFFGGIRTHEYRYTVRAPAYVELELRGDDGDVAVRDWASSIQLVGEDGDVRIDGLDGDLDIILDDGDVELSDCAVGSATLRLEDGDVHLRAGSGEWRLTVDDGDLDLRDLAADVLEVRTEDGDLDAELLPTATVAVDIRSEDGDIDLRVASGFSAAFEIDVDDGRIDLDSSGLTVDVEKSDFANGRIGDGSGGQLEVRTQDGNVTLRTGE